MEDRENTKGECVRIDSDKESIQEWTKENDYLCDFNYLIYN
jgi:hypothetical protein